MEWIKKAILVFGLVWSTSILLCTDDYLNAVYPLVLCAYVHKLIVMTDDNDSSRKDS